MASPAFPIVPSSTNNPIPGGYGNPTGANTGINKGQPNQAFPTFSAFGSPYSGTDFAGLSTGLSATGPAGDMSNNLFKELRRGYGKGTGTILDQLLSNGLFNPQTAAAILNAQQPGIARGQQDILSAFGDAGSRFSSSAQLGLGDYMSQVQLNQQQTLAQLYQNAQNQQMSLLQSILPTMHTEEANQGGGLLNSILGGLEIAGGAALLPFSGGLSAPLIGMGTKTLSSGGGSSNTASANTSSNNSLTSLLQQLFGGNTSNNAIPNIGNINSSNNSQINDWAIQNILQQQAGSILGGASQSPTGTSGLLMP